MKSYPSIIDRTIDDALSVISYDRIEKFDETNSSYHLKILANVDTMTADHANWIYAKENCT